MNEKYNQYSRLEKQACLHVALKKSLKDKSVLSKFGKLTMTRAHQIEEEKFTKLMDVVRSMTAEEVEKYEESTNKIEKQEWESLLRREEEGEEEGGVEEEQNMILNDEENQEFCDEIDKEIGDIYEDIY